MLDADADILVCKFVCPAAVARGRVELEANSVAAAQSWCTSQAWWYNWSVVELFLTVTFEKSTWSPWSQKAPQACTRQLCQGAIGAVWVHVEWMCEWMDEWKAAEQSTKPGRKAVLNVLNLETGGLQLYIKNKIKIASYFAETVQGAAPGPSWAITADWISELFIEGCNAQLAWDCWHRYA